MRGHWDDFDEDDEVDWMRHDVCSDFPYMDYAKKKRRSVA